MTPRQETAALRDFGPADDGFGSCVDGARGSRIFWLSACGRVQVMCPACLRGAHDRWP